jgi:hypothetical protein
MAIEIGSTNGASIKEMKIVKMVTQLPFKNANKQQYKVDGITTKHKNVKI